MCVNPATLIVYIECLESDSHRKIVLQEKKKKGADAPAAAPTADADAVQR